MAKKTTDEDEDQTAGAAEESDEDEDEDQTAGVASSEEDEDEDGDEEDEDEIIATLNPAQAKLFSAVQAKLTKANASARSKRLALKALRSGQASTAPKPAPPKKDDTGKSGGNGSGAAFDPEAFKAEMLAALKGEQEAGKVTTAAEKALRRAGLILPDDEDAADRKLKRVMRMLDLNGVSIDEVQDEIDDLKADNPELFGKRKKKRPTAGGVAGPARVSGSRVSNRIAELFD